MSKPVSDFEGDIGKKYTVGKVVVIVEEVLAEGGFGVVFRAKGVTNGQKYALKRLYVNEESKLSACKKEIHIMSSLSDHKNMVTFIDSSISRNYKGVWEVLILMQYYPGNCMQMLKEIGSARLKESEVLKIFCDICEAVSRLHHCQTPIIHRDLKIENILVESDGTHVLCDFGSATARFFTPGQGNPVEMEEDINQHTTLSHRSPEMINLYGEKSITTKADIWALGVTLYRLCFRSLPFGESTLAIQGANLNIPENSRYSKGLHALISYCLDVNPDTRPDIFQVSHVAFELTNKKCPVNNIHKVPVPDITSLTEAMLIRTSKSDRPATPKQTDRMRIERTTVTPRERPKAVRANAASANTAAGGVVVNQINVTQPVQRKLIPDGDGKIPDSGNITTQQLKNMFQQKQLITQQHFQLQQLQQQLALQHQQLSLYIQQQQQAGISDPSQYELLNQNLSQLATLEHQQQQVIQRLALFEQQLSQLQQILQPYEEQILLQQQKKLEEERLFEEELARQRELEEQFKQQQMLEQQQLWQQAQQTQEQQELHNQQIQQQQIFFQQLMEQQQIQQQQIQHQQNMQQYYAQMQHNVAVYEQQNTNGVVNTSENIFSQQTDQSDQSQQAFPDMQQNFQNAFDDDFSQHVLFEADFSQASFHPPVQKEDERSDEVVPPETDGVERSEAQSVVKHSPEDSVPFADKGKGDGEFKVPPIPENKPNSTEASHSNCLVKQHSKSHHRRNVSDTSAVNFGREGISAFKAYTPNKNNTKHLTASLGSLTSMQSTGLSHNLSVPRSKSEANTLSEGLGSADMKSSSVEALQNWNPFADDEDSVSDDVIFGKEFDRLRSGSQSSMQPVKSREDLVMLENGSPTDPFSAAPFYHTKGRPPKKESKITDKYSRLSAGSEENLLETQIPKTQNQTIFGVPIPFTRKTDRSDRYHKVPADSDNESLTHQDESSDEDVGNNTLVANQYSQVKSNDSSSSNSGTLTRENGTLSSSSNRPHSCDSNFSNTITPSQSSNENLSSDPFGAAPFNRKQVELQKTVQVDKYSVPLLPSNPFLTDIMSQNLASSQSYDQLNLRKDKSNFEVPKISSASQHDSLSLVADDKATITRTLNNQGLITLPRMPKAKTTDSIVTASHMTSPDSSAGTADSKPGVSASASVRRSKTDYELNQPPQQHEQSPPAATKDVYDDEMSDNETLLGDSSSNGRFGSLTKKKDKGRKSPKSKENKAKSPRYSDTKKSLANNEEITNSEEMQGALTNEAFSEQDNTNIASQDSLKHTAPPPVAPKPVFKQPHPPTAPKPAITGRPPLAAKPKAKEPELSKVVLQSQMRNAADQGKGEGQSSSNVSTPSKDFQKTHKRISSYDLATGRAQLSLCPDDAGKEALVTKETTKPKKKNRIGLGLF